MPFEILELEIGVIEKFFFIILCEGLVLTINPSPLQFNILFFQIKFEVIEQIE